MEEKTIISTIKFIATSGAKGIMLEQYPGVWYNPTEEAKEMINKEFLGNKVKLTLSGENKFNKIEIYKESETKPEEPKSKEEPVTIIKQNYFSNLNNIKVESEKKGNLTYASWAELWSKLKAIHPKANYHVHEDKDSGFPCIVDKNLGAFVKVTVIVEEITHTVHLPIMDHMNKSVTFDKLDSFVINKSIMRALAKAIAMHGLGLYIYKGEDIPEQ